MSFSYATEILSDKIMADLKKIYFLRNEGYIYILFKYNDYKYILVNIRVPFAYERLTGATGQAQVVSFYNFLKNIAKEYPDVDIDDTLYLIDYDLIYSVSSEGSHPAYGLKNSQRNLYGFIDDFVQLYHTDTVKNAHHEKYGDDFIYIQDVIKSRADQE